MRIGLIAPPWITVPPVGYGGTEAVVDQLALGLRAAGHVPVLAAHPDSRCPVDAVAVDGEHRREIGSLREEASFSAAARAVLEDAGVDVIHDHTVGCALVERPSTVPVVVTMHGPPDARLLPLYRGLGERAAVIAISRTQAHLARGVRVARVIHHGVDPDAYPVGDGRGGYLLHLGRMSPDKGIDTAIRVARRSGVDLVIASKMREPAERAYFDATIRPMLGPGVEFVGEVQGVEKLRLLGAARALLNPIRWDEPFGMVMIESLACGTPVIATPRGAAPEIVLAGLGRLVATEDEMVSAVAEVDRCDRVACRDAVRQRFSTRRMVEDHLNLYRELMAHAHHEGVSAGSAPISRQPVTLAG